MKKELPEKWYIVRTPENAQVLNEWADSVVPNPEDYARPNTHGYIYSTGESTRSSLN